MLKLGLVGYRNHAQRLIDIINSHTDANLKCIYHPTKKSSEPFFTNDFNDLFECDAILISSPNKTHFDYLQKLCDYKGYVYCEKPPVSSNFELEELQKFSNERISRTYFNFNHRFSSFSNVLRKSSLIEKLDTINHIEIISSHGLAFKDEYLSSWRADGKENLHNILETVTIHYLDLLNYQFGNIKLQSYTPKLISNNGSSFDSCHLSLRLDNDISVSIFNSYATPVINEISVIGTNGILQIRNNELSIRNPRDTFNSKGFFVSPPIQHLETFSIENEYLNSLKESINYFLKCVKDNTDIEKNHFETSLSTNQLIFEIEKMV